MAQGNYDHPSYLTRQQVFLGKSAAGANGTFGGFCSPSAVRLRTISIGVAVAGTATDTYLIQTGTTSVGQMIVAGAVPAIGGVQTSSDLNLLVAAGTPIFIKKGADTLRVEGITAELNLDPTGSWT